MQFHRQGAICESDTTFPAGSKFQALLDKAKEDRPCFAFEFGEQEFVAHQVPSDTPGWRVPVGNGYVYLLVGPPAVEDQQELLVELRKAFHCQLFYYNTAEDLLDYWRNPTDDNNRIEDYLDPANEDRSQFLTSIIDTHCPDLHSALEIGCNVGRNLNYLRTHKKMEVAGIEINKDALETLRKIYPALQDQKLIQGVAQECVSEVPDNAYDLVYSMAVLMHLHPDTPETFWREIVRVARKNIITIEGERWSSGRNWGRNYGEIFTSLGAKEIYCGPTPDEIQALQLYTVRVFEV